ncbi:MAG TPA: dioxygenase, partial [Tabrizicola sp.]|nr:dioxygenase [Tabrizicola sp.]
MDGQGTGSNGQGDSAEQRLRLAAAASGRLGDAVRLILGHAYDVVAKLQPSPDELDALVQFLTDVGYATDARRQEWVLLADVFGLTDAVVSRVVEGRGTPATLPGPFYRPDAPALSLGANLCRGGDGVPLAVSGSVT